MMAKTVAEGFEELLRRLQLTADQQSTASSRAKSIRDFFASNFDMAENAFTIGSYARGTLIRWERDIDILAPLSYMAYKDKFGNDSQAMLYSVRDHLNSSYSSTTVSSRRVAVKLDFTVIAADVVPCFIRQGGGYLMADGKGNWQATNPPYHTQLISQQHAMQDSFLCPLIKLMKAWNIANSGHLQSFHLEMMVAKIWEGADIKTPPWAALVGRTLELLPSWLAVAVTDPWGGGHIDTYLTYDERQKVVRMLNEDLARAKQAEQDSLAGRHIEALGCWNKIYRSEFPVYG